jgi:hypothetical protein
MRPASATMADGWRERDLRGDEGPAGSVSSVVHHARRGLGAARAGEAALFGATALCLALAAAVRAGAGLGRVDAWVAAAACAACAGLAWWIEHRRTPAEIARRLDERLRHQGALVTAFEEEHRVAPAGSAPASPLGAVLIAHVLARLRRREALRALRPGLALPVAAPLAGAAVLALALQLARVEPPASPLAAVSGGLVGRVEGTLRGVLGAGDAGDVDLAVVGELRGAVGEARALANAVAGVEAKKPAPPDLDARLAALDRKLADLATAERGPDLRAEISAARSWLDALRRGLGAEPPAADPEGAPEPGPAGVDPGTADPAVASGGGDGTMSGSTSPAGGGDAPSALPPDAGAGAGGGELSAGGAAETGAADGTWWPAAHDEIVRRWLERVRAAR